MARERHKPAENVATWRQVDVRTGQGRAFVVERVNGRLKDEFGGRFVRVRGAIKVKCHLMLGKLVLAVDQIFRVGAFPTDGDSEAPSSGGKITRSMNFARGCADARSGAATAFCFIPQVTRKSRQVACKMVPVRPVTPIENGATAFDSRVQGRPVVWKIFLDIAFALHRCPTSLGSPIHEAGIAAR